MHFIKQAVASISNAKKNTSKPTRMALTTLVAVIPVIKSIMANKMLPRIPSKRTESTEHRERQESHACINETAINTASKNTRAIMIALCNKTGAMVITPVI